MEEQSFRLQLGFHRTLCLFSPDGGFYSVLRRWAENLTGSFGFSLLASNRVADFTHQCAVSPAKRSRELQILLKGATAGGSMLGKRKIEITQRRIGKIILITRSEMT
jgi:hypothetical protein